IAGDQLSLHFQPIVDLRTGCPIKVEALLRWRHPQRGMVSPAEFIPLAEEHGLILDLGLWAFREAARWLAQWPAARREGFAVGVNMSAP
ncbi:EAL domain-containing protein, partial [Acinetobacter baumannii]